MTKTIYYSVQNGGDGSAYPVFFEDELCAELDQEMMSEGWGESCTGSLTIHSDNPITVDDVTTREEFIVELEEKVLDKWESLDMKEMYRRSHRTIEKVNLRGLVWNSTVDQ